MFGPTLGRTLGPTMGNPLTHPAFSVGPPGNPLKFFDPADDSIELSTEIIDQLSTEQQTYFDANPSWDTYALAYADISAQSWFNDENVIGTETGGVWIGAATTDRATLNTVLEWFGLDVIGNVTMGGESATMGGESVAM